MCWSVSGWRLTFRGLPSFTMVTGSSGSRYSWSARSRSSTSTNGSSRVAIASVLGPRVQHVGAVHEMELLVCGDCKERPCVVQVVEQPRVLLGQFRARESPQGRAVRQRQLDRDELGRREASGVLGGVVRRD